MKKKQTKLKDLLNESVLGILPSSKMFKYNKSTGTYEAPGKHTTNEEIEEACDDDVVDEGKSILGKTLANKWTSSAAAMNDLESFLEALYKGGNYDTMDDMKNTFKVLSRLAADYMKHMK
jgi:hypothetical protein